MSVDEFVRQTVQGLTQEDYAFTVTAHGPPWDVYRFTRAGKRGTVALRIVDKSLEIGLFVAGELTEAEILLKLKTGAPN